MTRSSIEFQVGTTAICLRGSGPTIDSLRPFLEGFPLQRATPVIQLALEELPDLRQAPPWGKTPKISLSENRWTLEQRGIYALEVNRPHQTGTLRYVLNNSECPLSPPKGAWLALKAFFSLDALINGGLMVHASAIRLGTTGAFFAGLSGAGKSTIAGMFPNSQMINDDIVLLTPTDGELHVVSTPFTSTEGLNRHHSSAEAVWGFHLEKSDTLSINPLPTTKALRLLLRCTIIPEDPRLEEKTFTRCHDFVQKLSWKTIAFPLEPSQVRQTLHHLLSSPG